tara:strand:- start:325 stop:531 length:207 start_codon:yes stop_codon:yes gene_type:complete
MNLLIFIIGTIIFTLYITGQILEKRWESREEEIDYKDYYERHSLQRKKKPKRKEGSQSRMKNYPNLKS